MNSISALGRPVEFNYPTNLAIVILSVLAIVAAFVFRLVGGLAMIDALGFSLSVGLATFLGWAVGREVDPDYEVSAFFGAILAFIGMLILDARLSILALFLSMQLIRILNRTTGLAALIPDSIFVLFLTAIVVFVDSWTFGMMSATVFLLDSRLPKPVSRHLLFAGLALIVMVIGILVAGGLDIQAQALTQLYVIGMVVTGLLVLLVILGSRHIRSVGDVTGELLTPIRVQAGQLIAMLTSVHFALWQGNAGVDALLPLWAAMLGAGIYRVLTPILPDFHFEARKGD